MKQTMLLIIILISLRCDTNEPPETKASLTLTLEDVSCTEVWLQLKLSNMSLPSLVTLYKNGAVAQNNILCYGDTLLYVDSLLPKQTYIYQASGIGNHASGILSNELSVTTMDTTSHNFTWQTWVFGQHSSSVLYDVAIINENNIWAVGEIYMLDSLGRPDPNCYNAVHWNGQRWELIKTGGYGGYPRRTVFAFSENDIWFDGVIHWDGSKYTVKNNGWPLMPNGDGWLVNKMWGSSSSDLYAVGNGGNIAHWDGVRWSKIESGTTVDLLDVWGTPEGSIVWACGYFSSYDITVLLKYEHKRIEKLYEGSPNNQINNVFIGLFDGIWTNSSKITYLINWGGMCSLNNNDINNFKLVTPLLSDIGFTMTATNKNNIYVAGQHGLIAHYNGSTTMEFIELKNNKDYLYGINAKNNIVCTVGMKNTSLLFKQSIIHLIKTNGE